MPEEEYKKAYHGTTHCNLHWGRGLKASVHGWMNDSDKSNIDRVGHRRWALNPSMAMVGFDQVGKYAAMYCMDKSRKEVEDFDIVAYPCSGFMPVAWFTGDRAWNVSLNTQKYQKPVKEQVKVAIYPLAKGRGTSIDITARKDPLELDYFNVENSGFGIAACIIFRPERFSPRPGKRYWVEIRGVKKKDGTDTTIEYMVEFARM
jgi:hypothetical protein